MKPANPRILTMNGGSSSIKFALFEAGELVPTDYEKRDFRVIHTDEEWVIVNTGCCISGLTIEKEHDH